MLARNLKRERCGAEYSKGGLSQATKKEQMAKVTLNPVIEAIQGKVGDLVFKRWEGEEIVGRMPDRTGIVPSPSQLAQQDKFRLAALYGKSVMADPESRTLYADIGQRRGIPAFAMSVADFLNAPAVDEVDLSSYSGKIGEVIHVRASDDVEVKGVTVTIRAQGGAVLEEGVAVFASGSNSWAYTTTTTLAVGEPVSIEVSATDRPGHKTLKTQPRS